MKFKNKLESNKFWQKVIGLSFCTLLIFAAAWQTQSQTKRKIVKPKVQTATIEITQNGYQPSSLRLKRGVPARLTFVRRTEQTCATEVVFSDFGIRRELSLNTAVIINFMPIDTLQSNRNGYEWRLLSRAL